VAFQKIAAPFGVITPLKMFSETHSLFDEMCQAPDFKAYYAKHLKDEDYYHYGNEKLFERLKKKRVQRRQNEQTATYELMKKKKLQAQGLIDDISEVAEDSEEELEMNEIDWNDEGESFREAEPERMKIREQKRIEYEQTSEYAAKQKKKNDEIKRLRNDIKEKL